VFRCEESQEVTVSLTCRLRESGPCALASKLPAGLFRVFHAGAESAEQTVIGIYAQTIISTNATLGIRKCG
jgi:hypothetical protein